MGRKRVITTKDPAVVAAEQLWSQLHKDAFNMQATIIRIIEARAWEPLGYESFSKAWVELMGDIELSSAILPHVVYQFIAEGLSPEEVSKAVPGIGRDGAERLAQQRENNVPPEIASPRRPSKPVKQDPFTTLFLRVQRTELRKWRAKAKSEGSTAEAIAYQAVKTAFDQL